LSDFGRVAIFRQTSLTGISQRRLSGRFFCAKTATLGLHFKSLKTGKSVSA
jgi:hypothetical protein